MPPTALIDSLNGIRRRVRILSVLYGVGIVVAAAIGLFIAVATIDYLLDLPAIPRIIVILGALVGLGYLLTHWVVKPALTKLGLSEVAGLIEHVFPDFNDRLRSTVDFITNGTPGSDAMKGRVVSEASELAGRYDLNSAIATKPVWTSAGIAGGAIIFITLLGLLLGPEYLSPAFSRLFSPFGGAQWPKRVQIEMVDPLPDRVPVGRHVDVRIRLTKGDRVSREAMVYYQYGDGRIEKELMTRGADGIYSASLDARADVAAGNSVMTVWMEAGDDQTPHQQIAIVQRLSVLSAQLTITPPPYVKDMPPATVDLAAAPVTVTYGSSLSLKINFNKTLDPSQPVSFSTAGRAGKPPQATWDAVAGSSITAHWVARDSGMFQVRATDVDGFVNQDMTDYEVIVHPDTPPTVQITLPSRNEECTPVAVVPLKAIATDDFGIESMKLLITRVGDKPVNFPTIDLVKDSAPVDGVGWTRTQAAGGLRGWELDYQWDLSKVDAVPLKPGDVIEYHLQVQDNYDFEGDRHLPVDSGKLRITILSQEQFTAVLNDMIGVIRDQVVDARNSERAIKSETSDLKSDTQKATQFTKADIDQARQLVARQTTDAAQVKAAAAKLDDLLSKMAENKSEATDLKDIANAVKNDLNDAAEHPMKDAANAIDAAKDQKADPQADAGAQQKQTDARNAQLDQAQDKQQNAADELDNAVSKMGEVGGLPKAIQDLKDILAQQHAISQKSNDIGMKNLGKTPDQMNPADKDAQQKNAGDQQALADKTQKAIDQMLDTSKKMEKTDPAGSQAMKQSAQTGQQQNVPAQMQQSAQQQQQNQQAGAQQAQAQVEIGLQMMIRQLEEAQRRKLEELAKQLADMQDQIKALIRQQSGLNYDNLASQGGDVLSKTDPKTVASLLDLAELVKDHLPPTPDLGTQSRLQDQTSRNTRNVAKTAEALPDGATTVAQLNRAADRMGRAIVFMRDDTVAEAQRLAGAYDPPQIDALAALQKAQEIIDQQAAKNNDQINQQKKDTIRAAFEKILASQKAIDADTNAIDKAPRNADGALGRVDAVKLAQLPANQGDVVDATTKLDDDLSALGSIVYVWANKDIADTMKSVKDDLAKPDTGVSTQAEQTRIEEQLTAMIDSLKMTPKPKSQFEQGHQGSGQGAGQGGQKPAPHLPTEAELQLLKQLQIAVNKSTTTISGQPNPDKPTLVALGGRQGELRDLLDQLLKKSTQGKVSLGPEPDPKDKLPEEATDQKIDDAELEHALLNGDGDPDADEVNNDVAMIGQRMGRSKQRLADDNDPGAITQDIQKRIVQNMDALIEAARAQQQNQQQSGKPQPGGDPGDPQPGQAGKQPGNSQPGQPQGQPTQAGADPAQVSTNSHQGDISGTPNNDITQSNQEWGGISPRTRKAVLDAANEKSLEKFKSFIDDYYKAVNVGTTTTPN